MTETTTILSALLALGSGAIAHLITQLKLKEDKINQLEIKIDKVTNLLMKSVIAMKADSLEKRSKIADEIIAELENF